MPAAMLKATYGLGHGGTFETSPFSKFGEVSIVPSSSESRGNAPTDQVGTALAISNLVLGVPVLSTRNASRSGPRNTSTRQTASLSAAQVSNLRAATAHADAIGLPFTRMITIHWEAAGVPLSGMAKATGRFIDLLTKATARHGHRTAWVWTHENGPRKGGHCHLLIHVPESLVRRVTGLQRGWLRRITGNPYRARVIHSDPIGGRLGLQSSNPPLHAANLSAALAYILKGAGPEAASAFGLQRLAPGGAIFGKRCGTSQNISAKARKAKG